MSQPILSAKGIRKAFGGLCALGGVDIEVSPRMMTMLIGPNGSGKTTFLNVVSGFYKPDGGNILFEGKEITGMPPERISKMGLVRTFQVPSPFQKLSVLENLLIAGDRNPGESFLWAPLRRAWINREREIYETAMRNLELLNLSHLKDEPAGTLSGGQLKLLEVGRALMTGAKMIMMDEPASGLNPTLAHKVFEHLEKVKKEAGLTFLIIEHRLDIALQYVDYVYAMANGTVISRGKGEEVMSDPRVIEGYLGSAE
ncbi:MAG: ABC transporter ATP-binding protein [Candidatus Verstraetearchaeota archaeon]|nr:ABC transporter ATP-binding protein [Candidatus Verstraetearchaeota archaeon]